MLSKYFKTLMQDEIHVKHVLQLYHRQSFAHIVSVSFMLSLYLWVNMFTNILTFSHNYAVVHKQQAKAGCKLLPRLFVPFWGVDFSVGDLNGEIWRNWFFKMVVFSSSNALLCKMKNIYIMKITIIETGWINIRLFWEYSISYKKVKFL